MNIEIFMWSHVGYLILGIVFTFYAKIAKVENKDKKLSDILWIVGSLLTGCSAGVLTYWIAPKIIAIIGTFAITTVITATISYIIGNLIQKKKEVK